MNFSQLKYTLATTFVPGVGVINQRKIHKAVNLKELWSLSPKELKGLFGSNKEIVSHLQSSEFLELAEKEIEFCVNSGIQLLSIDSEDYPQKLKECSDSPLVLFKKGNYEFNKKLHIAVVGTRKITAYGKKFIEEFIQGLSSQNLCIISGLAYGCDVEAHRNCIEKEITNVAVLAHHLNVISPKPHAKEAHEIVKNGALLTEYPSFYKIEASNFVQRNRIIAGLSDAVVVVESDKKGGALITAEFANSYNREVFAVPGRVHDKFSLGCNRLIQSHQAYMLRNAEDLLDYFNLKIHSPSKQRELFIDLDSDEKVIYEHLKTNGRKQIDELALELSLPSFQLNSLLLNLELKGVIRPLAGKFFELI